VLHLKEALASLIDVIQTYNGAVTAIATAVIAFFTVVLAWVTNRQARLTKQSVRISELALTELERPVLHVVEPTLSLDDSDAEEGMRVNYKISNFGRTPATLHEISVRLAVLSALPKPPEYGGILKNVIIVPQGQTIPMLSRGLSAGSRAEYRNKPGDGGVDAFFFGYMKYTDIFGNRHFAGFALKHDAIEKIWLVTGGPDYNFHRLDQGSRRTWR
jgi:hypothetical protein